MAWPGRHGRSRGEHGGGFEHVVAALVRLCGVRAHRGTTGNGRLAVRYDLGRGSPGAGLSAPQREAIMLAFYSGHRYHEVADMLGIPVGTDPGRADQAPRRHAQQPSRYRPAKAARVQPHCDDQPPQRQRRVSRAASAAFMAAGRPGRPAVPGPPGVIRPTYPAHAHGLGVRCGVGAGSLVRPLEAGEKITVCSSLRARFAQRGAAA